MKQSSRRLYGIVTTSLFLLGVSTSAAFAAWVDGPPGYFTVGSHQYVTVSSVDTSPGDAFGVTTTAWSAGNTQAGYAGARGRVFECSTNNLTSEGSIQYNAQGVPASGNSGNWYASNNAAYSWGVAWGYNGSGYSAYYSIRTTCQSM